MNKKKIIFSLLAVVLVLTLLNVHRALVSNTNRRKRETQPSELLTATTNSPPPLLEEVLKNPTASLNKYGELTSFQDGMVSATLPLMIANLLMKKGPILEMGLNLVTTPLLNRIAQDYNRSVESIDLQKKYDFDYTKLNRTSNHRIRLVDNYDLANYGTTGMWAIVFVDHSLASMRASNVIQFRSTSQIVLAHDAELNNDVVFKYETMKIKNYFKFSCKFTVLKRLSEGKRQRYYSTLILSDFVNLNEMKKILKEYRTNEYEIFVCVEP
jgi:hypothetical protein